MPRYFIDIDDGEVYAVDEEGSEWPDLLAARSDAVAALQESAKGKLFNCDRRTLATSVRDEAGRVLFKARLSLTTE